jgi:nicotinate-nucleotide adenylyltransferase
MNIALFGGAFNPITCAHEFIGAKVHEETGFPVFFMPCWGHKFGKEMASYRIRMGLVETAVRHTPYAVGFRFEILNKCQGSMYETMVLLKKEHNDKTFYIVIGMDNANRIFEWDRGEKLIAENPFIIFRRPNNEVAVDWIKDHRVVDITTPDISSTMFRNAMVENNFELAETYVSKPVWGDITQYGLFGYPNSKSNSANYGPLI